MPEEGSPPPGTGPIDADVLDRVAAHLDGSRRFSGVTARPTEAPNSVVVEYDLGYFPSGVDRAYLRIRWFETDDFGIHYSEQYGDESVWECRWDRHPNSHNTREHFHPLPDASTPGEDAEYPSGWRGVLARVIGALDERIRAFWD